MCYKILGKARDEVSFEKYKQAKKEAKKAMKEARAEYTKIYTSYWISKRDKKK